LTAIMRCFALAWLSAVQVASAQDTTVESPDEAARPHMNDEVARRHFEAGRSLYNIGRFVDAAVEFEEALRLSGRPELHYNVYVSHRDAGNPREAADALRRYMEEVEEPFDRPHLEARLRALEESMAERDRAEAEAVASATAERGPASADAPPRAASGSGIVPWVVVGAGGAVIVAGAVVGVLALSVTSAIEDQCAGDLCPSNYDGLAQDVSEARGLATTADVLVVGGAVLVGAGLLWVLLSPGEPETEAPLPVALGCGAGGCGASWGGRF